MNKLYIVLIISVLALTGCGLLGSGGNSNMNTDANALSKDDPKMVPEFSQASEAMKKGDEYLELGLYRMAIRAFKQAAKIDPANPEAHFKLGVSFSLYVKENPTTASETSEKNAETAFKNAVTTYKRLVREDPEDAAAYFNLGRAYQKLFRDGQAANAMGKAVRLDKENGLYRTELGSVLIKLARYTSAIRQLEKALEIDEDNVRAEELLEKARAGRKRVVFKGKDKPKSDTNSNTEPSSPEGEKAGSPAGPVPPKSPPPLPSPPANKNR